MKTFSRNNFKTMRKQQGVAIITALLIVTIATVVSIKISTRLQLDIRRTSNLVTQDQAYFFLLAAEAWSMRVLKVDKEKSKSDNLNEGWAFELPPLPVEGGSVQGKLTDLQSCYNLNVLVTKSGVNATIHSGIKQLFNNLKLKPGLLQAITDWMDADMTTTYPDGAEDGYYLNLTPAYRVANTPMQSPSELRLVRGFDDKTYQLVAPYFCAYDLQENKKFALNVNTASAQVLKSISDKISESLVSKIIEQRKKEPFKTLADFLSFSKLNTILRDKSLLTVSSDYFLLRTQAKIGNANKIMYSIIYRDDKGKSQVISRRLSVL